MYLELLQQLATHSQWSRQSGNSSAMLMGAVGSDAVILVADKAHERDLARSAYDLTEGNVRLGNDRFMTIDETRESLMHLHRPLLIDHHTLEIIISGALREMREIVSRARLGKDEA